MATAKARPFEVFGRFVIRGEGVIEIWRGLARTPVLAVRKAATELWKRPAVRWKHVTAANFLIMPNEQEATEHGSKRPDAQRHRPKSRHRRK